MNHFGISFVMAALLLTTFTGHAAEADPMDANVKVPAVKYRPALGGYQSYREAKIGQWRQLNAVDGSEQPAEQSVPSP